MNESIEKVEIEQRDEVITQLEQANIHLAQQNALSHIFFTGIIQGIGFFIGSAIIATVALGIFGPLLAKIPFVHDLFQAGSNLTPR